MVDDRNKVFVALSGGVDSSIATALLKRDGKNNGLIGGGWIDRWSVSG